MIAHRVTIGFALLAFTAAAAPAAGRLPPAPSQPFSVQDLVRLERISEIAASPDGKRVVYTLRSTDMEADKGRTTVWLIDSGKRGFVARRLTDLAANSNCAEWSADGRFVYFLSNRSGTTQVWRVAAGGADARESRSMDAPGGDAVQITDLPLDVGSFRVSPTGNRILVSVDVFVDC